MRSKFIETIKKEMPRFEEMATIEGCEEHAQGYLDRFKSTILALEQAPESFFTTYKHLAKDADGIVLMIENGRAK